MIHRCKPSEYPGVFGDQPGAIGVFVGLWRRRVWHNNLYNWSCSFVEVGRARVGSSILLFLVVCRIPPRKMIQVEGKEKGTGLKCVFQSEPSHDLSRPIFRTVWPTTVYAPPQGFHLGISLSVVYPTDPLFGRQEKVRVPFLSSQGCGGCRRSPTNSVQGIQGRITGGPGTVRVRLGADPAGSACCLARRPTS
jgi:hypothetical protein